MTKPLEEIRVLDWTMWHQGPIATALSHNQSMEATSARDDSCVEQRGSGVGGGQPHTEVMAGQSSSITEAGDPDSHRAIIIIKKGGSFDVISDD
jgi:hypothetical protein